LSIARGPEPTVVDNCTNYVLSSVLSVKAFFPRTLCQFMLREPSQVKPTTATTPLLPVYEHRRKEICTVVRHPGPIFHSTAAARRAHVSTKIIHTLSTTRGIHGPLGSGPCWLVMDCVLLPHNSKVFNYRYRLPASQLSFVSEHLFGIQSPPPLSRPLFPFLRKEPATFPLWKSVTVPSDRQPILGLWHVLVALTYSGRHNSYSKELFDWRKNKPKCILDLSTQSSGRVGQFFICLLACYMVSNHLISSMDQNQLCAAHVHSAAPARQRIVRQLTE
jgi:hypothetical protein